MFKLFYSLIDSFLVALQSLDDCDQADTLVLAWRLSCGLRERLRVTTCSYNDHADVGGYLQLCNKRRIGLCSLRTS